MILETALKNRFAPGTNPKHRLPGAGWAYLLPSLELGRTVVLGAPTPAALEMLARVSRRVTVLCDAPARRRAVAEAGARLGLDGLEVLPRAGHAAAGAADLLVAADGPPPADAAAWLAPGGLLYHERLTLGRDGAGPGPLPAGLGAPLVVRETPLLGEVRTAIPLGDAATAALFRRRGVDALSLSGAHVDRAGGALRVGNRTLQRYLRQAVRLGASGLFQAPQRAERALVRRGLAARLGVLAGVAGAPALGGPPRYLAELAAGAGATIEGCRWGLAARGEYRSQKVLFYLLDGASGELRHIVKLTRDPAFNWRLENEHRALVALQAAGLGDAETLARPAFLGRQGGLAVLGETALTGVSFASRTTADASCPLARGAIDWLVELAAATAQGAEPAAVAAGLEALREQYVAIYRPEPRYAEFLAAQVAALGASPAPLKTVFQCGDVGAWNALVTPSGRLAFTDWEAADLRGMPLWDLFYFMRSFTVMSARAKGGRDPLQAVDQLLLADSPFSALLAEAAHRCCDRLALPRGLAAPLFFTCWMYWALRESLQREPESLAGAGYRRLLHMCIDRRDAPLLRALAQDGPAQERPALQAR